MDFLIALPIVAKKTKPGERRPSARAKAAPATVDDYIAGAPEPARGALLQIRAAIQSAVPPQASETISYGIPAFRHNGVLVWFAAFKNHCSFFPTASVIEEFKSELKGFAISKGTIHFPLDKPVPPALIKKMVKARAAQMEAKKRR